MATANPKSGQMDFAALAVIAKDIDLSGDLTVGDDLTVTGDLAVTGAVALSGGATLAPVAIADAATYAVLVADSGKLHAVPDVTASITVTLPAAAAGLTYEFMYSGAAADAQNHIFVPTAGFYIGNVTFHDSQADATTAVFSNGSSNDVFTLVTPASYTLKFVSNGTNWYVSGHVQSATVCTMAN
jgi:hypothetical protein